MDNHKESSTDPGQGARRSRRRRSRHALPVAATVVLACVVGGCGARVAAQRIVYVAPGGSGTHCATDTGNTPLPPAPGPDDVPLAVLAHAGLQGRYRALAAAVPPVVDYVGASPAANGKPVRLPVVGSGFTRASKVRIGVARAPHVRFVAPNVLVATVRPRVAASMKVTVTRDKR